MVLQKEPSLLLDCTIEMPAKNYPEGLFKIKSDFGNHIHITGIARSGTSLIKNLFLCFDNTIVCSAETLPDLSVHFQGSDEERLEILKNTEDWIITKQPKHSNFSEYKNISIIHMIRDPRDIITSLNNNAHPGTDKPWHWNSREFLLKNYFSKVKSLPEDFIKIKYEDLVSDPDKVQEKFVDIFGFNTLCKFSEWHKQKQIETDFYVKGMHGIRPISSDKVGRWKKTKYREEIVRIVEENPHIKDDLKEFGYEVD